MKISHRWLQAYITLPQTPEAIAKLLTDGGLEVEHLAYVEAIQGGLKGVVIGKVLTCEKHPDADKLKVTTVDVGAEAPLSIVCGAPNVAAGQTVVVATVGTTLYPTEGGPLEIKKAKIRGQLSEGMICAEDELGLGQSHAGIIVIDEAIAVGTPAANYFKLEADAVFEIGLTANRADAASHYGAARDLQALTRVPATLPRLLPAFHTLLEIPGVAAKKVTLADASACPRYVALALENIAVQPSNEEIQKLLRAIGLNPINHVVDVTNYVLHGLGQPLHAFDLDKVEGDITVRFATAGETIVTLDGIERKLTPENLLIADEAGPIAVAGVFGGLRTGVTAETKRVLIESAYFNPAVVRKSAQLLGLKTDSSFRFERGTDPWMCAFAAVIAAQLLSEKGAMVLGQMADHYPQAIPPFVVEGKFSRVRELAGSPISDEEIQAILTDLQVKLEVSDDQFIATVPPFKVDVTSLADLVEEVVRIHGIDNIPTQPYLKASYLAKFPKVYPDQWEQRLATQLVAEGYVEMVNLSMVSATMHEALGLDLSRQLALVNPLSPETSIMRMSLLPGALNTAAFNLNRQQNNFKLFEFGRRYLKTETETNQEEPTLLGLFTGDQYGDNWQGKAAAFTYFDAKDSLGRLLQAMNMNKVQYAESTRPYLAYGEEVSIGKIVIGYVGTVSPKVLKTVGIEQPVYVFELDWWAALSQFYNASIGYAPVSKFPAVRRDLSLVVAQETSYQQLEQLALQTERKLLKATHLFDVYQGEKLGEGKKAYALSFTLQDQEQTLTDQAIDKVMQRLQKAFETQLGAVVRQ